MEIYKNLIMVLENLSKVNSPYSYDEYSNLVIDNVQKGTTTGSEQLIERIEATKINAQRMTRIEKQVEVKKEISAAVSKITDKWEWIVIAESWCGDAAQNIPIIAKIANLSPNINFKIVLRDQNLELMDAYLTNGARSIPKLICFDAASKEEIGIWGSRPVKIQQMVIDFKKQNVGYTHDELVKNIHLWYAKDKGEALQSEFLELLKKWTV